jgi:shikimate dehydrogenase
MEEMQTMPARGEREEAMPIRTGLLGWPLGHSVSPAMHDAAFAALGLAGRYELLPVPPQGLAGLVGSLAAEGFRGVNVTIPHKQAVMPLMDGLSDAARLIGAVNTVVVGPDGRLHGDNTDWLGFLHPLDARGVELAGKSALLLGAGGAARAVVYALAQRGIAHIAILNRTRARAEELAAHARALNLSSAIHPSSFPIHPSSFILHHSLIINTTPLGMFPHPEASPWPADLPFPPGCLVYDLVYRPERTALLRQAAAAGCPVQGGLEMLVVQGAAAFERWTGQAPPLPAMMAAARSALATTN